MSKTACIILQSLEANIFLFVLLRTLQFFDKELYIPVKPNKIERETNEITCKILFKNGFQPRFFIVSVYYYCFSYKFSRCSSSEKFKNKIENSIT